jgi:D-alanine-D-alanine ligase
MGGPSREREVSLKTGAAVADALARRGHDVLPVRIAADGRWELPAGPGRALPGVAEGCAAQSPAGAMARIEGDASGGAGVDAVFVALHGAYGEDGTVQGFLETLGVAYTGSGVAASVLAMDKERAKEVLTHHGVRTAPWASVTRDEWTRDAGAALARVETRVGLPAVVKQPREGSSFGIHFAADTASLRTAVAACVEGAERRALVERRVAGTEVTCPVLGNAGGELRTLPLVEIVPRGREYFDFEAKYEGASDEICPARVPEEAAARVRDAALTAHRVLGCDGISRSDFIVDAAGDAVYLETNTVPGMTAASLCPLSARHAGMSFEDLCDALVRLAIERRRALT